MGVKRYTFLKTNSVAGTPERLVLPANDIRTKAFNIQALESNTGHVRVGGSDVSLTNGIYLDSLDSAQFSNENYADTQAESRLSQVYIVTSQNGEGVIVTYELGDDLEHT
jgi:hypothetical protein